MHKVNAIEKENVLIRAGSCAVTILPWLGGKIASIRLADRELLQSPLAPYEPRTRTMSFDSSDASGWDECLPSVAACSVKSENGMVAIPDHGDLWRVEWQEKPYRPGTRRTLQPDMPDQPVASSAQGFSLPLRLDRSLALTEVSDGANPSWHLRLDYTVTNTGRLPAPWSWVAHPLFAVEEGDRIVLPASIRSLRVEGSGGNRLGPNGSRVTWPMAKLANGFQTDLSVVQSADSGIGDKLFAGPLCESENWCALERPRAGVRIRVRLDRPATPYLGLWLCYGGWPERAGTKQMCVALEPATAPVDSLAEIGPWSRVLAGGECYSWFMEVQIETI